MSSRPYMLDRDFPTSFPSFDILSVDLGLNKQLWARWALAFSEAIKLDSVTFEYAISLRTFEAGDGNLVDWEHMVKNVLLYLPQVLVSSCKSDKVSTVPLH